MRKPVILLGIIILTAACSKDEFTPIFEAGPKDYGCASAKKNNLSFVASGVALVHDDRPSEYFALFFDTFTPEGFWRERLSVNEIKFKAGEYSVSGSRSDIYDGFVGGRYVTLADDGDVAEDRYILEESKENRLIIIKVDIIENIVKGTFHLKFEIDPNREKRNPNNPDKVVFSEGEFEVSFRD